MRHCFQLRSIAECAPGWGLGFTRERVFSETACASYRALGAAAVGAGGAPTVTTVLSPRSSETAARNRVMNSRRSTVGDFGGTLYANIG